MLHNSRHQNRMNGCFYPFILSSSTLSNDNLFVFIFKYWWWYSSHPSCSRESWWTQSLSQVVYGTVQRNILNSVPACCRSYLPKWSHMMGQSESVSPKCINLDGNKDPMQHRENMWTPQKLKQGLKMNPSSGGMRPTCYPQGCWAAWVNGLSV